ncbi:unnamed protein product [uncultured bacterium]|nr:unnamed protein product [uncultured bacterium]
MASPVLLEAVPEIQIELPEPLETDEALYEVVKGQRVETPPMSIRASIIASNLGAELWTFAEAHGVGWVVIEGVFRVPIPEDHSLSRRPDVAFVSADKMRAGSEWGLDARAADVVPDLAVEVTSPTDCAEDQREKILEYFQAGVRAVWVVYPRLRIVDVYESPTRVQVLTEADTLRVDPVLPGFELALSRLFETAGPRKS